jgi:taurine dioxygenase
MAANPSEEISVTDIDVRALEPFGVEVACDARDQTTWDELKRQLSQHGLIVLRSQELSMQQQVDLLGHFGPVLHTWSGVGYVSNTKEGGKLQNYDLAFHSDYQCTESPYEGISLHAVEVEDGRTSTSFASTTRALQLMPTDLRAGSQALEVVNIYPLGVEALGGPTRPTLEGYPEEAPRAVHSVVKDDPITKQPASYANAMHTAQVVGLSTDESNAFLDEFEGYLYHPTNIYEHWWQNGDLVVWANNAIHHARSGKNLGSPRTLQRVCLSDKDDEYYDDKWDINASPEARETHPAM